MLQLHADRGLHRIFCVFISTLLSAAYAHAGTTVRAPCAEGSAADTGLRSCQEFLITGIKGVGDSAKVPGLLSQLDQRVRTQIGLVPGKLGYYQKVDPNPLQPPGLYFGPTLCNLVPGPFNDSSSEKSGTTNRLGESCGNPVDIQFRWVDDKPVPKIMKRWNGDASRAEGTLEDGYGRGGAVAATSCYYQQVVNEIRSQRRVTIADLGGSPGPCAKLSQAVEGLTNDFAADVKALKGQLSDKKNIADIINCEKVMDPNQNANVTSDAGSMRQSAQQLCALRLSIESMFTELAACEIFARANYSFRKQIGSEQGQRGISEMLKSKIAQVCADRCEKKLDRPWYEGRPSAAEISNCVNPCYMGIMPKAYGEYLKRLWADPNRCDPLSQLPARKNSQELPENPSLYMIGMLAFIPRRRSLKRTLTSMGATLIAVVQVTLSCGCGADKVEMPEIVNGDGPGCASGGPTQDCSCLTASAAGEGNCPSTDPGSGSVTGALIAAAEAGNTGAKAGLAAKSLESDASKADNGGLLAQGEAATIGEVQTGKLADKKGSAPSNVAPPTLGSGGNRGGGSGSGGRDGGSAGNSLGSLSTAPSSGGSDGTTAPSGDGNLGGSYVAGGGAAAGAATAGGFFSRSGASMDGGEGGSGTTEESFTPEDAGALGKVSGSDDPEDYFTRLGLNDNLFKIVERRYRQKSTVWTTDALRSGALK